MQDLPKKLKLLLQDPSIGKSMFHRDDIAGTLFFIATQCGNIVRRLQLFLSTELVTFSKKITKDGKATHDFDLDKTCTAQNEAKYIINGCHHRKSLLLHYSAIVVATIEAAIKAAIRATIKATVIKTTAIEATAIEATAIEATAESQGNRIHLSKFQ